jgi:hypothetical protein
VLLGTGSAITPADFASIVSSIGAQYTGAFIPHIAPSAATVQVAGTFYTPGGGVFQSVHPTAVTGGSTTGIDDNSACAVVSWLSTVYWRGGKPRTYLPALPQTFSTDGHSLTGTATAAFAADGNTFLAGVNALTHGTITSVELGMISFFSGNVPRTPPVFFAFTGATCHSRIATQRRRLGKWTP